MIVAEIGINHFGNLKIAKHLVDEAKKAGIEYIKVQIHIPECEMSKEAKTVYPGNSNKNIYDTIAENCLTLEEECELYKYIINNGMKYIATPFSLEAVDFLKELRVSFIKIGSGEVNNLPLIQKIKETNIPVILSSGLYDDNALDKAVVTLGNNLKHVLHCVSMYPQINSDLYRIIDMQNKYFGIGIGYSDHSIGINVPITAMSVITNVCCKFDTQFQTEDFIIEKHFKGDLTIDGPDMCCSMTTEEAKFLVDYEKELLGINMFLPQDKDTETEIDKVRNFANASIVPLCDIEPGTILSKENLTIKRPSPIDDTYFSASEFNNVIGKTCLEFLNKNQQIKKEFVD